MSTITMKYTITKIVLVWAALAAIVGISKKRENESLNDAVKFPDMGKTAVVEDFEIAAYHNQA
jgi:CRISPR/Cas system-associated endonuclease Cas3-HD